MSPSTHPSGATLRGPSRRARRARSTAVARSATSRNCAGGSSWVTGMGVDRVSARASQPLPSAPTVIVGRSTATVTPGWSSRQSAATRSSSAFSLANATPGFGRKGASSVSGTGLLAHAPYAVALERSTTCAMPTPDAASSTTCASRPSPSASPWGSWSSVSPWARCTSTWAPSKRGLRSAVARSSATVSTPSGAPPAAWRSMATTRATEGSAAARAQTRRPSAPAAPVTSTTDPVVEGVVAPLPDPVAIALRCPCG